MAKSTRGGKRPRVGRRKIDPEKKSKTYSLSLTPEEARRAASVGGGIVQDGIRKLIEGVAG